MISSSNMGREAEYLSGGTQQARRTPHWLDWRDGLAQVLLQAVEGGGHRHRPGRRREAPGRLTARSAGVESGRPSSAFRDQILCNFGVTVSTDQGQ